MNRVITSCQDAAARFQRPDESQLQALQKEVARLTRQIKFLLENAGETDEDRAEAQIQLKTLRDRRMKVEADVRAAEHLAGQEVRVPTESDVKALIENLESTLHTAGELGVECQEMLGGLLGAITGGRIYLSQAGEKKKHRGWLQGRFVPKVTATVLDRLAPLVTTDDPIQEVVIDYHEKMPSLTEQRADQVKELYDKGLQMKDIADAMKININSTIKALKFWYKRAGLPYPNNAIRRGALRKADPNGAMFKRIAPEVVKLVEAGWSNKDISKELKCSRDLITKALQYYDQQHGTSYCDLKTRKRMLNRRPDSDQAA